MAAACCSVISSTWRLGSRSMFRLSRRKSHQRRQADLDDVLRQRRVSLQKTIGSLPLSGNRLSRHGRIGRRGSRWRGCFGGVHQVFGVTLVRRSTARVSTFTRSSRSARQSGPAGAARAGSARAIALKLGAVTRARKPAAGCIPSDDAGEMRAGAAQRQEAAILEANQEEARLLERRDRPQRKISGQPGDQHLAKAALGSRDARKRRPMHAACPTVNAVSTRHVSPKKSRRVIPSDAPGERWAPGSSPGRSIGSTETPEPYSRRERTRRSPSA